MCSDKQGTYINDKFNKREFVWHVYWVKSSAHNSLTIDQTTFRSQLTHKTFIFDNFEIKTV